MEEKKIKIDKTKKIRWGLVILMAFAFVILQIGQTILFDRLGISPSLFAPSTLKTSLILAGSTVVLAFLLGLIIPVWEREYAKDNALTASLLILIYRLLFEAASLAAIISWLIFIALPMLIGAMLMAHFKK